MDRKEHWQVSRLHAQIVQGTFSEEDVFALLMLLREYSAKDSPVRECADFIAHREKDRGQIFEYLVRTKNVLDNLGKVSTVLEIKPVFSMPEMKSCLESCLAQFSLAALTDLVVNGLLVCIISLLQDVRLVRRDGVPIGVLEVAISKTEVVLLGKVRLDSKPVNVVFPVFVAKNDFMDIPEASVPIAPQGVSWASCENGKMSLIQKTAG